MKKFTLVFAVMVCFVATTLANTGDPVAKVMAQIEKADIQLTPQQMDMISQLADQTVLSIDKSVKTSGQKGSRKDFIKEQRQNFKSEIYNNVFTTAQKDKWNTFKGR